MVELLKTTAAQMCFIHLCCWSESRRTRVGLILLQLTLKWILVLKYSRACWIQIDLLWVPSPLTGTRTSCALFANAADWHQVRGKLQLASLSASLTRNVFFSGNFCDGFGLIFNSSMKTTLPSSILGNGTLRVNDTSLGQLITVIS